MIQKPSIPCQETKCLRPGRLCMYHMIHVPTVIIGRPAHKIRIWCHCSPTFFSNCALVGWSISTLCTRKKRPTVTRSGCHAKVGMCHPSKREYTTAHTLATTDAAPICAKLAPDMLLCHNNSLVVGMVDGQRDPSPHARQRIPKKDPR